MPYALGGALALGVWGFPRATNDVDLDIFVAADDLAPVLQTLGERGYQLDADQALASARTRGDFNLRVDGMRVDVFIASIPFYDSVQRRIRQAPIEGRPAWFLSPEDLTVFKLLFFRAKDLLDVERLVAFLGERFDDAYVRRWLIDLVGSEDERVRRWDRLVAEVRG